MSVASGSRINSCPESVKVPMSTGFRSRHWICQEVNFLSHIVWQSMVWLWNFYLQNDHKQLWHQQNRPTFSESAIHGCRWFLLLPDRRSHLTLIEEELWLIYSKCDVSHVREVATIQKQDSESIVLVDSSAGGLRLLFSVNIDYFSPACLFKCDTTDYKINNIF